MNMTQTLRVAAGMLQAKESSVIRVITVITVSFKQNKHWLVLSTHLKKYERQIGSSSQVRDAKKKNIFGTTT